MSSAISKYCQRRPVFSGESTHLQAEGRVLLLINGKVQTTVFLQNRIRQFPETTIAASGGYKVTVREQECENTARKEIGVIQSNYDIPNTFP